MRQAATLSNVITTPPGSPASRNEGTPWQLDARLLLGSSQGRTAVEQYIQDRYWRVHAAHINEFLPVLMELKESRSRVGALGLSPGCFRPMFLEQYLDGPIEQQVSSLAHQPVDRCDLIEIGNFVVTRMRWGPLMMAVLVKALAEAGFRWMVFTVTPQVEWLMRRFGFEPHFLVSANPDRLLGDKARWGRYYEQHPSVMVGDVSEALRIAKQNESIWSQALKNGPLIAEIAASLGDYRRIGGNH